MHDIVTYQRSIAFRATPTKRRNDPCSFGTLFFHNSFAPRIDAWPWNIILYADLEEY
jgi:hypothetical protein